MSAVENQPVVSQGSPSVAAKNKPSGPRKSKQAMSASPRASPSLAGPKKSIDKKAKPLSKAARQKQLNKFTNPIVVLQSCIKHHKMQVEEFKELNEFRRPSQQLTKEIEYLENKIEKEEGRLKKMLDEFEKTTARAREARQQSASGAQKMRAEKAREHERKEAAIAMRKEVLRKAEEAVARGETDIESFMEELRKADEADAPKKMEVDSKSDDGSDDASEKAEEEENGEEEAPHAEDSDKADDSEEEEEADKSESEEEEEEDDM